MKVDTTSSNLIDKINCGNNFITDKLGISDSVCKFQPKEEYILLKDHKPYFRTKPSTCLISRNRSKIGRISKPSWK